MAGLVLSLLLTSLEVTGPSTCPSPAQVSERLDRLNPPTRGDPPSLRAILTTGEDGAVRIELQSEDGEPIANRLLTGSGSCEELAAATGALLWSWARELEAASNPVPLPLLDGPVPASPPQTASPPAPPRASGRPAEAEPKAPRPADAAPMPTQDLPEETAQLERVGLRGQSMSLANFDLAAGLSLSWDGGPVSFGGVLTGVATLTSWKVGASLSLAALGARRVEGVETTWERFALHIGPHYRLDFDALWLDFHLQPTVALLSVISGGSGPSYAAFDPGLSAGVRLMSRVGVWADVRGNGWLLERRLPNGSQVPRLEALFAAGLAWSWP